MLAVSPLTSVKNERESQIQGFSMEENEFQEFTSGKLLDSIDFDDIFVGISDGDVLPDLEMDQDILADFSVSAGKESDMNLASVAAAKMEDENNSGNSENPVSVSVSDIGLGSSGLIQGEEIVSKREEPARNNPSPNRSEKSRKSSGQSKNPPGKKKPKVDWTPELHRRFVQAVEQLGLDKAVPSRILEIMGINCLTRHNIASHLQKYRSHRKHLLAREAEAASWSQRRRMYGTAAAGGGAGKIEMNPWIAPTMGFPPVPPMPHFRPLHVWGHPSFDQSFMPMWPKHLAPPPPLPHTWPPCQPLPPSPPADPSFWHSHRQYVLTTGTPCFPPHLPPTRFPSPPVAGVPPPVTYKVDTGIGVPAAQTVPQPPSDIHPSKESIDAAIGGVIKMPWLPLPLGLKPPSIDSVITELQRQGISKIPPTSS